MSYTPGPWEAVISSEFDVAYVEAIGKSKHTVAAGMTPANARLIAAAPDLLKAAKKVHEMLGKLSAQCSNTEMEMSDDMLADAIAAAEGRA